MIIQSLSVVVPNKTCINNCCFCVSRMRAEEYPDQMTEKSQFFDLYLKDYKKRLEFARDNGCNTVMLTGNSEPQQNKSFLRTFSMINESLEHPFRWIEIQTTGILLDDEYLRFLRNTVGVSTISLSISDLWSDEMNKNIIRAPRSAEFQGLDALCANIKKYDFNLRLSVNLTKICDDYSAEDFFYRAKELKADQITFRVLYEDGSDSPQSLWVKENRVSSVVLERITSLIAETGRELEILPYGRRKFSVDGIGVVIDNDCMAQETQKDTYKYLILRENCKLYSKWDDPGSLIF